MGWIDQDQTLETLKVLVLGDYGTGKSYFASTFPEPIFLFDFDKGRIGYAGKRVYVPDYMIQETPPNQIFSQMEKDLDLLIKQEHPEGEFKTIVLDSLTTMMKEAMNMALQKKPLPPDSPPVWNVHYPLVKVYVDRILDRMRRLNQNLVVIGHIEYQRNDITGEIIASPSITGNLKTYIPAIFDEVYFSDVIQTRDKKEYVLLTSPSGFKKARSRLSSVVKLPDRIPNTFEAIASAIKSLNKAQN